MWYPCKLARRPWKYDNDAIHHGRSNTYTLMHNGQKITLQPMTLAEIVQVKKERLASGTEQLLLKLEINK